MKKVLSLILASVLLCMAFVSCTPDTYSSSDSDVYERIASGYYISSSALIALGLEDRIVGIEDKSAKRPIYELASPGLVERCVNVGSAKAFDLEACISSEPDLAVLPKKAADYAPALEDVGIKVTVVAPENFEALQDMILLLGQLTGSEQAAEKLTRRQKEILDIVLDKTQGLSESEKPVVYMCAPSSYLSTCPSGMYQADMIRAAGGINAGDCMDGNTRVEVSYEQLIAMNPEVIIIPTNETADGGPEYTKQDIMNDPELKDITAVKNGAIYYMPQGLEAFDSPVPSCVIGTMWLLSVLHPGLCTKEETADTAFDFYREFYGFDTDRNIFLNEAG